MLIPFSAVMPLNALLSDITQPAGSTRYSVDAEFRNWIIFTVLSSYFGLITKVLSSDMISA